MSNKDNNSLNELPSSLGFANEAQLSHKAQMLCNNKRASDKRQATTDDEFERASLLVSLVAVAKLVSNNPTRNNTDFLC